MGLNINLKLKIDNILRLSLFSRATERKLEGRTKKQKSQENSRIGLDIRIDKNRIEYISTLSTMHVYIFLSSLVCKQLFSGFNVFEIFAW